MVSSSLDNFLKNFPVDLKFSGVILRPLNPVLLLLKLIPWHCNISSLKINVTSSKFSLCVEFQLLPPANLIEN